METIILKKDKDCKHSVRFSTNDKDAAIQSVYVVRKSNLAKKAEVKIIIE